MSSSKKEQSTKSKHGGFRENAKRPLKYGEETVNYNCRVPKSQKKNVDKLVKDFIKQFEVIKTKNG